MLDFLIFSLLRKRCEYLTISVEYSLFLVSPILRPCACTRPLLIRSQSCKVLSTLCWQRAKGHHATKKLPRRATTASASLTDTPAKFNELLFQAPAGWKARTKVLPSPLLSSLLFLFIEYLILEKCMRVLRAIAYLVAEPLERGRTNFGFCQFFPCHLFVTSHVYSSISAAITNNKRSSSPSWLELFRAAVNASFGLFPIIRVSSMLWHLCRW